MFRTVRLLVLPIVCVGLAAYGLNADQAADDVTCSTITSGNIDDCVRLNEIQVLGTHNSYHIAPVPAMLALLDARGRDVEYTHRPLIEQL